MHGAAETSERLVCAVLAAQVAALRDRTDIDALLEVVWQATDTLASLSGLVTSLASRETALEGSLFDLSSRAVADAGAVRASLEALAFLESQRHDFGRQVADCVVIALERLAMMGAPPGDPLTAAALAELYVCEEQRQVHAAAIERMGLDRAGVSAGPSSGTEPVRQAS